MYQKCTVNIIKVCITTVFPFVIYTPTCFDILCHLHHQGVTLTAPCYVTQILRLQLLNFIKLLLLKFKILCLVYNKMKSLRRYHLSCNQCVFVAAYTVSCRCCYCAGPLRKLFKKTLL